MASKGKARAKPERADGIPMLRRGFPLFSQKWLDLSGSSYIGEMINRRESIEASDQSHAVDFDPFLGI